MLIFISSICEDPTDREFILKTYSEYERLMYATAKKYIHSKSDCQDIVQDSVEKLLKNIHRLRVLPRCNLASYIVTTVRNTAINHLRKENRQQENLLAEDEIESSVDDFVENMYYKNEQTLQLKIILLELSHEDRIILEYKYFLDYSDEELAQMFNINSSSIRMRLTRARRRALTKLNEKGVMTYDET